MPRGLKETEVVKILKQSAIARGLVSQEDIAKTVRNHMVEQAENLAPIVQKTSTEDHIYFNVSINNNSSVSVKIAQASIQRSVAIIDNPSDYYCSIIRFTVPLQQIPIFIFQDSLYSVTISNGATDFQTILSYVPSYTPVLAPTYPESRFVYSYQQFLDSINNALSASFIASGLAGTAPYMIYNPETALISLVAPATFHNAGQTDENQTIKVWFNTNLWVFFSNFEKIFNGYVPQTWNTNGKNFNIIIKPNGTNNFSIPADHGGPLAGLQMSQEFSSLYNWNILRNIVFTTNTIPIRSEGIPSVVNPPWNNSITYNVGDSVTYNNNQFASLLNNNVGNQPDQSPTFWQINQLSGVSSSSLPILTDFQLLQDKGPEGRSYAQYFPSSEYRLVDLMGNRPLTEIDLQIQWQDRNLNLYPIYINPLDSADIKIMFRKKSIKGSFSYYN